MPYELVSSRTKERRNLELGEQHSLHEILDAAIKKLNIEGNKNGAELIKLISFKESADEIMKRLKTPAPQKLSPEAAVSLILVNKLSKTSYNRIRSVAISLNHDLYPSYKEVSSFS